MSKPRLASGWAAPVDLHEAAAVAAGRRSKNGKHANTVRNQVLGAEGRRAAVAAATAARWAGRSPGERSEAMSHAARARMAKLSPAARREFALRGSRASLAKRTPEQRRESARNASLARWARVRAERVAA